MYREENIENLDNLNMLIISLNKIYEKYKLPIIFPIHPRTKKQLIIMCKI